MIYIEQLSHAYRQNDELALKQINLHIEKGKTIGLLGPNGAGKTTLMSILAGLQSVQKGRVLLENTPLHQLSKPQRQQLSLVPQDFAFYPLLTVWENLCFFASLYQVNNLHYLQALLERTGLISHQKKLAKQLSGGLKRRLNFAIGLINQPKIIFLDEITVGIDPCSRQFILSMLKALQQQGVTIIYTSHYLQEIEQLCDKLVLLQQGQILYQGNIQDILSQTGSTSLENFYLNFLNQRAKDNVNSLNF